MPVIYSLMAYSIEISFLVFFFQRPLKYGSLGIVLPYTTQHLRLVAALGQRGTESVQSLVDVSSLGVNLDEQIELVFGL